MADQTPPTDTLYAEPEAAPVDRAAIHAVHRAAFGRDAEADLVDALRRAGNAAISLVAVIDGDVVGSIVFSPAEIEGLPAGASALGLAPLAVAPAHQRRGIGRALVRAGLDAARSADYCAAIVLGDPVNYRSAGFVSASRFGLSSEYDAPDDAFMAIELRPGALNGAKGLCRYAPEFRDL